MASTKVSHVHLGILTLSALALFASVTLVNNSASIAASKANAAKEVNKKECDAKGSPVINVTQKVVNSMDSGTAGNYWAYLTFNRHIQVWEESDGTFCALVDYDGRFDAQEGQRSPGNTADLTGSEDGNFKGGYRATITGVMKAKPELATKGSVGTVDYKCNVVSKSCAGGYDWTKKYFEDGDVGFTFSYGWWGWTYHTAGNHTWVNSSEGNSGDVL